MIDEITIKPGEIPPRVKAKTDPRFVKHVNCDGAHFHVLWWDSLGEHCTEKDCIRNRRP
jgi:hypothetical protein